MKKGRIQKIAVPKIPPQKNQAGKPRIKVIESAVLLSPIHNDTPPTRRMFITNKPTVAHISLVHWEYLLSSIKSS